MGKTTEKHPKLVSKVKTSQRKAELEGGLEDVMNRDRTINAQEVISANKIEEVKGKVIKSLFEALSEFGVDPNDLESINSFLAKLEKENPDLLRLFEIAFNDLIGGPENQVASPEQVAGPSVGTGITPNAGTPSTGTLTPPGIMASSVTPGNAGPVSPGGTAGLMNNYKNLAQKTMMPR